MVSCNVLSEVGFEKTPGITQVRGRVYSVQLFGMSVAVLPTFHPAAVLHNPKYKDGLELDFQLLKFLMENPQQGI